MRLKPFDHVVAILLVLTIFAVAVVAGLLCWIPDFEKSVITTMHYYFAGNILQRIIITAIALIIIFLCLRVIFIRRRREARPSPDVVQEGILLKSGENGTSYITIKAIDAMVKKFVRNNTKVRDCKVNVKPVDDQQNLSLQLQVVLLPDINIPEVCTELQDSLAAHIQSLTGILVKEVRVSVDDSTEPVPPKQRSVK